MDATSVRPPDVEKPADTLTPDLEDKSFADTDRARRDQDVSPKSATTYGSSVCFCHSRSLSDRSQEQRSTLVRELRSRDFPSEQVGPTRDTPDVSRDRDSLRGVKPILEKLL